MVLLVTRTFNNYTITYLNCAQYHRDIPIGNDYDNSPLMSANVDLNRCDGDVVVMVLLPL